MKQSAYRIPAQHESRSARPAQRDPAAALDDRSQTAAAQRQRQVTLADSPQSAAQRARLDKLAASVPQRARAATETSQAKRDPQQRAATDEEALLQGKFAPLQRMSAEEEEPLQAQFDAAQRVPDEEELLQGKFAVMQRAGIEDEEPLQGKFGPLQRMSAEEEEPLQAQSDAAQRVPDEEELLQGKFAVMQRAGIEDEEPLQGKFGPLQRMSLEEEEPLQAQSDAAQRVPDEEEEPLQGKFGTLQRMDDDEEDSVQLKSVEGSSTPQPEQETAAPRNDTGLPDTLKSGIEQLSGFSLAGVKVHYNSSRPATMQAHAYAQGQNIHIAPGQERHLPHEAWHVVQQMQGRVRPTWQAKGVSINDDAGLEREADVMGQKALQSGFAADGVSASLSSKRAPAVQQQRSVMQRQITVTHVDYDPNAQQFRDGFINQAPFYVALRAGMLNSQHFGQLFINRWGNVHPNLAAQNFAHQDIDNLTTLIVQAVQQEYQGENMTIAGGKVAALTQIVRSALVANIQADHMLAMDQNEATGYDQLAQAAGAVVSRAKGVPNTIQYGNLPGAIQNEVTARLNEIRNERALWTVAAVTPDYTLPDNAFSRDICARQSGFRYQGNHTNNAGWLPNVAAPIDLVTPVAQAIYHAASPGLSRRLSAADALIRLDYPGFGGQGRHNAYRTEYDQLRTVHMAGLNNANVKLSAMAALAQGVSSYIEFSMAGGISRLLYNPVNNGVYITAHYKWRNGNTPFFQVLGYPAV